MCTIIKHESGHHCTPGSLYISGYGLAYGKCGALCECENKRQYEIEKKKLEEEWEK